MTVLDTNRILFVLATTLGMRLRAPCARGGFGHVVIILFSGVQNRKRGFQDGPHVNRRDAKINRSRNLSLSLSLSIILYIYIYMYMINPGMKDFSSILDEILKGILIEENALSHSK